jgi:hypothetical protein
MSHHVEYRTTHTQISIPVSATRKTWSRFHRTKRSFILKHSYQDQNQNNRSLSVPRLARERELLAAEQLGQAQHRCHHCCCYCCKRMLYIPSSLCLLSTLYILLSPATSIELQGQGTSVRLYGVSLLALDCVQEATLVRVCVRDRRSKRKHNTGGALWNIKHYSTTRPLG